MDPLQNLNHSKVPPRLWGRLEAYRGLHEGGIGLGTENRDFPIFPMSKRANLQFRFEIGKTLGENCKKLMEKFGPDRKCFSLSRVKVSPTAMGTPTSFSQFEGFEFYISKKM
jgi:hypothetical protein